MEGRDDEGTATVGGAARPWRSNAEASLGARAGSGPGPGRASGRRDLCYWGEALGYGLGRIIGASVVAECRIVVCGIGTEVGKTHVGVALLHGLRKIGKGCIGLKPVETGVPEGQTPADVGRLSGAATFHVKHARYEFVEAISPHLAAKRKGTRIDVDSIVEWVASHDAPVQVVETAGGALSPLSARYTNLELIRRLEPHGLILVAPDRLGVLHDVGAAISGIQLMAHELDEPLVALSAPLATDDSTGTNAGELQDLHIAKRVHVFPRGNPDDALSVESAVALLGDLGLR